MNLKKNCIFGHEETHLKVNCVSLIETLFHLHDGVYGIPFKDIEVTDAVPVEEWPGHPSMGPIHHLLSIRQLTLEQRIITHFQVSPSCEMS
jgi:hypothetical protein